MNRRRHVIPWRVANVAAVALALFSSAAEAAPARRRASPYPSGLARGAFAFHYAPVLSEEALAWYSRFDILVTHDPVPREQVERLHAAGTRVLLYEWSTAFYGSRARPWQRELIARGAGDLLNATPLTGGAGSAVAGAWYFDPATPEHEFGRAEEISRLLEETGYDGVFFDAIGGVHPQARQEYERRHPHTPYDLAYSRFLAELRRQRPQMIIFTNQGYRRAPYYLPWADWDLTESLITRPVQSTTTVYEIRPWNDQTDPWNSIQYLMSNVIEPIAAQYPHVRFGHLNYAGAAPADRIELVVAVAQLFGSSGYVAAPSVGEEKHPIYFRNPGVPTSARTDRFDGAASYRYFDKGLVAVTAGTVDVMIFIPRGKTLRNHLTGEVERGDVIKLPATGKPRAYFFDYE